jgi:hypothetical protein
LFKELLVRPFATLGAPWSRELLARAPILGVLSVAGLALLAARGTLRWRQDLAARSRALRLALWVLLSVLPVYSLFFVGPDLAGSRYLYLAEVGFAILLADLLLASPPSDRAGPAIVPALAIIVLVVSVWATTFHIEAWRGAARLRDRVVAAATSALTASPCPRPDLANPPDSLDGAYVFRNGFAAALRRAGLPAGDVGADMTSERCRLVWDGAGFAPVPPTEP